MGKRKKGKGEFSMATAKKLDQVELNPKTREQFDHFINYLDTRDLPGIVKIVDHTYKPTPRVKRK